MAGMFGGYGPPGAAPIRKSSGSGCLLWGLGGCGALAVLGILAFVVGIMHVNNNPNLKSGIQKMLSNAAAPSGGEQTLVAIRSAMDRYKAEHAGKYPPTLAALAKKYLPDRSATTCGGEGFQTEYTPPKPD